MLSGTAPTAAGAGSVTVAGGRARIVGTPGADLIEVGVQTDIAPAFVSVTINGHQTTLGGFDNGLYTELFTIRGLGGDDVITVETAFRPLDDAIILGGLGDDVIHAHGLTVAGTRLSGGAGDDTIELASFELGAVIDGGAGNDDLSAAVAESSPPAAPAAGLTVLGGDGDDTIYTPYTHDLIRGGAGDDLIFCGPGDDTAYGDAGDDSIRGQAGDDALSGGDGDDRLLGGPSDHGNRVFGDAGRDTLISGSNDDLLRGGAGADRVFAA